MGAPTTRGEHIPPRPNTSTVLGALVPTLALILVGGCGNDNHGGSIDTDGTDSGSSGADSDGNPGEKFDVASGDTDGPPGGGDCPGAGGEDDYDFSIIWIANSPEGTVSKIDTKTATELARYRTGPGAPDPSRTSVNLKGAVAIANRGGSVTKIAARLDECVDANADGQITTSQGANDILDWGEDECVLWHHDILTFEQDMNPSNEGGPRAIAWDGGDAGNPCDPRPNLWVGWRNQPDTEVLVRQLDGDDGSLIDETTVPDWQGQWDHGTYGGASDKDGAFWALGTLGTLIKVEPDGLAVTRWDNAADVNPYGLALDSMGNPWLAGFDGALWRFDRDSEQFVDLGTTEVSSRMRGLAIDGNGHAWIAGNNPCGLIQFDTNADVVINAAIPLEGCSEPVGVSIDSDDFVWVVDRGANRAYKVNPETHEAVVVDGLVGPYTYSDMTGAGLDLVINPPG